MAAVSYCLCYAFSSLSISESSEHQLTSLFFLGAWKVARVTALQNAGTIGVCHYICPFFFNLRSAIFPSVPLILSTKSHNVMLYDML